MRPSPPNATAVVRSHGTGNTSPQRWSVWRFASCGSLTGILYSVFRAWSLLTSGTAEGIVQAVGQLLGYRIALGIVAALVAIARNTAHTAERPGT